MCNQFHLKFQIIFGCCEFWKSQNLFRNFYFCVAIQIPDFDSNAKHLKVSLYPYGVIFHNRFVPPLQYLHVILSPFFRIGLCLTIFPFFFLFNFSLFFGGVGGGGGVGVAFFSLQSPDV